jgi:hypothetical protein
MFVFSSIENITKVIQDSVGLLASLYFSDKNQRLYFITLFELPGLVSCKVENKVESLYLKSKFGIVMSWN